MAFLPDLATAGGIALAVFLLSLGVLVVFVEAVPRRALSAILIVALALTIALVALGEVGLSFVPLGFGLAFVANGVFEWLTTR